MSNSIASISTEVTETDNRREQLNAATQETRFKLLSTIIAHPSESPTLKELSHAIPSKSKSTIRNHLETLIDHDLVEIVRLPKEKQSRDLPSAFYRISEAGYEIIEKNDLVAEDVLKDAYEIMEKPTEIRKYEEAPRPDQ